MRFRAAAFPLLATLSWGVKFPVLASALDRVDPLNLTAARYLLASVALVALPLLCEGRAGLRAAGRGGGAGVLGVVGFAGFNLLTNLALEHAAPQQVALFVATTPLITQGSAGPGTAYARGPPCWPSRWWRSSASVW